MPNCKSCLSSGLREGRLGHHRVQQSVPEPPSGLVPPVLPRPAAPLSPPALAPPDPGESPGSQPVTMTRLPQLRKEKQNVEDGGGSEHAGSGFLSHPQSASAPDPHTRSSQVRSHLQASGSKVRQREPNSLSVKLTWETRDGRRTWMDN